MDFGPGCETAMHRGLSIDYNTVIEGEFELILDSGESRILRRGDLSVQRATAHKWRNISGGGKEPGRLLNILLDCIPPTVNGAKVEGFFGDAPGPYGFGTGKEGAGSS